MYGELMGLLSLKWVIFTGNIMESRIPNLWEGDDYVGIAF
jgi:hypothetical protein